MAMTDATDTTLEIETSTGVWTNIINETATINIRRAEWEVGTLTAVVRGATVDPAQVSSIRPGKDVRVRAYNVNTWKTLYTGTLTKAETKYEKDGSVTVSLNAADNLAVLASAPADHAPETVDQLRGIIGTAVPFVINGSSATTTNPDNSRARRYRPERLTLLDAISLTRDTNKAFAWVDNENVLQVRSALSTTPTFYYATDTTYVPMPDRINYQLNPRGVASSDTAFQWTGTNATGTPITGGGRSFSVSVPSGGRAYITPAKPAVGPAADYQVSVDIRQTDGTALNYWMEWRNNGGTWSSAGMPTRLLTVGGSTYRNNDLAADTSGNWEWRICFMGSTAGTNTGTVIVDNALVQDIPASGSINYSFFDGDSPGAFWEGERYFSRSMADPAHGFTFSYTDIDVGFDTTELINVVNIKTVETVYTAEQVSFVDSNGTTREFTAMMPKENTAEYQYKNQSSIDQWGARSFNVTLLAPVVTTYDANMVPTAYSYSIADWATTLMNANSAPVQKARSIKFPVKDGGSRNVACTFDFFHQVNLKYKSLINADQRVTGIEHSISPGKWLVTLTFDGRVDSTPW